MHIFQWLSHLRLSNCFFVPQSCSAKWSSRAEVRCVREAWTLRLFPILRRRTPTHLTSHHPQPLQQGGKVKSLMISPALLLILLLLLIYLKLVDRIALWYVFEEKKSSATNWVKSLLYFEFFSATMPELPHPYYTYKKVLAETKCSRSTSLSL